MATPAFLRYLPARLKPLGSPAVWVPLTVFTLLSVFIWEYHKNPDWFNRPQISNVDPNSDLTSEEQAQLSEVDTLDLLLRGARMPGGTDLPSSLIDTQLPDALAEDVLTPDRNLAGRDNPFAVYEEQYKFPGSQEGASAQIAAPTSITSADGSSAGEPGATSSIGTNALSEALNRQQAVRSSDLGSQPPLSIDVPSNAEIDSRRSRQSVGQSSNLPIRSEDDLSTGNSGSLPFSPAGNSGISAPFIRTTTEMSPPVGTTGYQAPATTNLPVFNVPPQQATRNPFRQQAITVPTPAVPATAPTQAAPTQTLPTVNYTAPSFTQPEQNRRR